MKTKTYHTCTSMPCCTCMDLKNLKIAELQRCLAFFASVIKSGESWTSTCQQKFDEAMEEKYDG